MIEKYKNFFLKFLPVFYLGLGAGAIFFSSIILKPHMESNAYGHISIFLTFYLIVSVFAGGAFEQVLIRLSSIKDKEISFSKYGFFFLFLCGVGCSIIIPYIFHMKFSFLYYGNTLLISISYLICILLATLTRLSSFFSFSQFFMNFPKVLSLLMLIFILSRDKVDIVGFQDVVNVFTIATLLAAMFSIFVFFISNKQYYVHMYMGKENIKKYILLLLAFSISVSSVLFIGHLDKFLINEYIGVSEVGDYFYMVSFYMMPPMLLVSFLGFKELVEFKKNPVFKRFILIFLSRIKIYFLFLVVYFSLCSYFYPSISTYFNIDYLEVDYTIVLLMFFILLSRGGYALISAAFGAFGNVSEILKSNIIYAFLWLPVVLLAFNFLFAKSISGVLLVVLIIWLLRGIVFYRGVVKSI